MHYDVTFEIAQATRLPTRLGDVLGHDQIRRDDQTATIEVRDQSALVSVLILLTDLGFAVQRVDIR